MQGEQRGLVERYAGQAGAGFRRKTTFDTDLRAGELEAAITRAKAGDSGAICYLYHRFAGNVYGYCRSIVDDDHEAEDIVQEVFVRLMSAIASYQPRGLPFASWLLRIAHNTSIDHLRRRRAQLCAEPVVDRPEGGDRDMTLSVALREGIAELPMGQREVVYLRHVAGWTPPEIAERLGKSEEAVHGLHHRGRRRLQAALIARAAVPTTLAA